MGRPPHNHNPDRNRSFFSVSVLSRPTRECTSRACNLDRHGATASRLAMTGENAEEPPCFIRLSPFG